MDSKKTVYPYIPNSAPDVQAEMMAEVGISDVMELYEEIPEAIRYQGALNLLSATGLRFLETEPWWENSRWRSCRGYSWWPR